MGCACRGDQGLCHLACKIRMATHAGEGFHEGWVTCFTCRHDYTGEMQAGLAHALCARYQDAAADDMDRTWCGVVSWCDVMVWCHGVISWRVVCFLTQHGPYVVWFSWCRGVACAFTSTFLPSPNAMLLLPCGVV